ncbi:MAG: hypothetical protein RJP95_01800 [Pirellulales bacterium]
MVREPDYIYGIVPERGEYGFEEKPSFPPTKEMARVQSLASQFQWAGGALESAVALAVDPVAPPLVTQYVTDPRDPAGRISMRMKVWVCASKDEAADLVRSLWPNDMGLPIGCEEFLADVQRRPEGSSLIGPADQFFGVDFDRNWGAVKSRANPTSTRRPSNTSATQSHRLSISSGLPLKWIPFTALFLVSTIALVVVEVKHRAELDRSRAKQSQFSELVQEAQGTIARLKAEVEQHENAAKTSSAENESLKRTNERQEAELQRLRQKNAYLQQIVDSNPVKADQAELAELRLLKERIKAYIGNAFEDLQGLKDALPGPHAVAESVESLPKADIGVKGANP